MHQTGRGERRPGLKVAVNRNCHDSIRADKQMVARFLSKHSPLTACKVKGYVSCAQCGHAPNTSAGNGRTSNTPVTAQHNRWTEQENNALHVVTLVVRASSRRRMIGTIHEDRHNDGWQLPRRREAIKWKIETEAKNQFPRIMGAANN